MKKMYVTPTSELIQIKAEGSLLRFSQLQMTDKANNYLHHKPTQNEIINGNEWASAPFTRNDAAVAPGEDIDFASKVNPWGSWDE